MAHARPPVAKDFDLVLSTRKWQFILTAVEGLTASKAAGYAGMVCVAPSRESLNRLDTIVHETLHASLPGLSEAEVSRVAGDVAKVLWKAGYRR